MNGPSTFARSTPEVNPQVTSASGTRNNFSAFLRAFLGIAFATALALSPAPAFAQHGGGGGHAGGGGGGHFGGGGGGRASGGGGGRASGGGTSAGTYTGTSAGSRGGSSTGSTSTGAASTGSASGGARSGARPSNGNFSTGPGTFVPGGVARGSNASHVSSTRYAGGNNTWQAPPNATGARIPGTPARTFLSSSDAAASGARVVRAPTEPRGMRGPLSASTAMRGTYAGSVVSGLPPHIGPFPPRRYQPVFFFGGGCFGGFYPGFCGGGFFGGGFWGFGYGWGCDPFWGCPGWYGGYNNVYNGGYYNGGSYGNVIYGASTDDSSVSNEFNPSRYANSFEGGVSEGGNVAEGGSSSENGGDYAAIAPEMALYLKDGTVYALSDYWVADGKLHYVTNYGGENSIDLEQIDMQRTVDVNAKRGISVTLKPAPAAQDQAAPPAPAPQE